MFMNDALTNRGSATRALNLGVVFEIEGVNIVPQNSYFLQGVLGVHDGSVVWSGVRMREYPPRCVTSKPVRLDEFC